MAAGRPPRSTTSRPRPASRRERSIAIGRRRPSSARRSWPRSQHARSAIVKAVADADGTPVEKLEAAIRTFASRALQGRRLAYALIAEPVDPEVETVRLDYRAQLAHCLERILREGIMRGVFPRLDPGGGCSLHRRRLHGGARRAAGACQGHRAARRPPSHRADHPVLPARQRRCARRARHERHMGQPNRLFPSAVPAADGYATHEVMNQATPLVGHNAFTGDRLLTEIAGARGHRLGDRTCSPRPARRWRARASPSWRARPTAMRPSSGATTASAIASTRSPSTRLARADVAGDRPGHACAVVDRQASPARMWRAACSPTSGTRAKAASAVRSA